jgi:pseudouridine-5'-phosphate glycosidase
MIISKHRNSLMLGHALSRNGPVVFLESTLIAQGLPGPENHETALAMEAAASARGPA